MSGMERAVQSIFSTTKSFSTNISSTAANEASRLSLDIYTDPGDWRFFGFALGVIVAVLGTGGNGLTLWAYNNNRNLQTSFNVLITNLCCLELIFSCIILPLQLPGYILKKSPYPEAVCTTIGYFYYCSLAASLHNLVAIAINRYVGIVNAKRYQKMFTGNRLRIWVCSIWLTSPLLYIPLAVGGAISWRENSLRCAITSNGSSAIKIYNTVLNIVYQAGGLICLVVLYSSIIGKVNKVKKKMKIHRQASLMRPGYSKYKITARGDSKSRNPTSGTTSATTSGDEGIDDYKPSSIISGGFKFLPGKGGKNAASDSGHISDHESGSHLPKVLSDMSHSQPSHPTITDEPVTKPQARRTSLWQVLFRSKASKELDIAHEHDTPDCTTDDDSKRDETNDGDDTKDDEDTADERKESTETPDETVPLRDVEIVMRNTDEARKDNRRKKSLSAPTMPSQDEIMRSPRKCSMPVVQNIPEQLVEVDETVSTQASPRSRAFTVGSKYIKHYQRGANGGSVRINSEKIKHLLPSLADRLCGDDKEICTSMPTLALSPTTEPPNHPRFGTIAKRIKDQKIRRERRQKRKQRNKAIRRRQARERQLVYSSLTICIAFAICILPTSLLSVFQTIFKFQARAAIVLVVSCISWLHSIVNPFIYGYMNHLYRKEYGHIAVELKRKLTACVK